MAVKKASLPANVKRILRKASSRRYHYKRLQRAFKAPRRQAAFSCRNSSCDEQTVLCGRRDDLEGLSRGIGDLAYFDDGSLRKIFCGDELAIIYDPDPTDGE